MHSLIKVKNQYSIDKIYIVIISFATLAPGMGAIDNNGIRWLLLGLFSTFYIVKLLLNNRSFYPQTSYAISTIIGSFIFLLWSVVSSPNPSEGLIAFYKLIIIVAIFYTCVTAFKNIENPLIFISKVFGYSLFIEGGYAIIDFIYNETGTTGIANNSNISSSSIIIKLSFLVYLNSQKSGKSLNILFRITELLSIISIVVLQSRLGLLSLIIIYIMMFFYFKSLRKYCFISLLISILTLIAFNSSDLNNLNKSYNIVNISNDESTNQRVSFYKMALNLFTEKPIAGHGLGSWKYESLQYKDPNNKNVLVPYYVHNDLIQILMELGIIGLSIYLVFLRKLAIKLIKHLNSQDGRKILLIALSVFFLNTLLNFPIHRSQEYIPFIMLASLIFAMSKIQHKHKRKKSYVFPLLLVLLIPSTSLAYYEHNSLVFQKKLFSDYSSNTFSLKMQEVDKINYKIPSLSSNAVPMSSYIARYFININDYEKALKLLERSYQANRYDLITNELLLKVFIFTNRDDQAYKKAKELFFDYYNNENYAELYFTFALKLNLINEMFSSNIITKSDNVKVHRMFFQNILKSGNIKIEIVRESLRMSARKFPQDKYLNNLLINLK